MGHVFDLATAAMFTSVGSLLFSAIVFGVGRTMPLRVRAGANEWAIGLLLWGTGFLIVAVTEQLPAWASPVVANGLLVFSVVPMAVALRRFHHLSERWVWVAGSTITLFCMAENFWFLQWDAAVNNRLAIGSLCQLAVSLMIVTLPASVRRPTFGLWIICAAFAIHSFVVIDRAAWLIVGAPLVTIFDRPSMQVVAYLSAGLIPLASVIGFTALCSELVSEEFKRLASVDYLTGCLNRRAVTLEGERMLQAVRESSRKIAVVLIDLNELGAVNDTWGHPFGDLVLNKLVTEIHGLLTETDVLGRLGGDEFLVILGEGDIGGARLFVNRLRARLKTLAAVERLPISASMGAAVLASAADDLQALIGRADEAMYMDKAMKERPDASGIESSLSYKIKCDACSLIFVQHSSNFDGQVTPSTTICPRCTATVAFDHRTWTLVGARPADLPL